MENGGEESHRKVVKATTVNRVPFCKVEAAAGVEALLIFSVTAFCFAIVARCIRTKELYGGYRV